MTLWLYELRRWTAMQLHRLALALYSYRYFCDCEGPNCPDGTPLLCWEKDLDTEYD